MRTIRQLRPDFVFTCDPWLPIKHAALDCYRLQFTTGAKVALHRKPEVFERQAGQAAGFLFGELLKLLAPVQLHIDATTWRS